MARWQAVVGEVRREAAMRGIPSFYGGMCGAPVRFHRGSLRGTKGIMTDMYRRPETLIQAMERITPLLVEDGINEANASGCPIGFIPLHKGTSGFMSQRQFETFYWPTLRQAMLGLIGEGLVPLAREMLLTMCSLASNAMAVHRITAIKSVRSKTVSNCLSIRAMTRNQEVCNKSVVYHGS